MIELFREEEGYVTDDVVDDLVGLRVEWVELARARLGSQAVSPVILTVWEPKFVGTCYNVRIGFCPRSSVS